MSTGVIVVAIVAAVLVERRTNDLATSVSLSLAGGALLLAAVAAWAATLAYADTLRAPSLTWHLSGPSLDARTPAERELLTESEPPAPFPNEPSPPDALLWFARGTDLTLQVTNSGDTTARNVLATLTFAGMRVYSLSVGGGWTPLDTDAYYYATTFVWDGGPSFALHGSGRARNVPTFQAARSYLTTEDPPSVQVDVVCDGFDSHARTNMVFAGLWFPRKPT